MRLIVTRPEEDAGSTAEALAALGHTSLIAPMLRVEAMDFDLPDDSATLVITSANAARHGLARVPGLGRRRVFAVGAASAAVARSVGATDPVTGPGDAAGLLPLLLADHAATGSHYCHLTGEDIVFDIAAKLTARGVRAERRTAYRAVQADVLPDDVASAIRGGSVDGVLFYSARAALAFERGLEAAGLAAMLKGMTAYAMSKRIAAALAAPWGGVVAAAEPTEAAVLALIGPAGSEGEKA
ncbi:uroporphyrinogen-III synthase [Gimibacter soli]|uniref:Uroporphyrinogen-III synthase n=1 Tax=Gimibacter soli TaxID=3024400 RepID=A0AAE9XPF2_9PROT|nr:uroporphyrinogen-III synthase [Gimibacter soli]WCL54773.1 uroporphyrinogen-III synthase [Gimibacter soli]